MSTGLPRLQAGGSTASRRASVSGDSSARRPPSSTTASVARTPNAAAVGHDGEAVAGYRRASRQDLDGVEQLLQRPHAEHAGASEGGLVDGVGAGERAGVGGGRPGALLVAAGLDDDHRLERGTPLAPPT